MNKYAKLEMKHEQDKYIIGGVIVALVLIGGLMVWLSTLAPNSGKAPIGSATSTESVGQVSSTTASIPTDKVEAFAKYLTAQGIKMYGASSCAYCKRQKAEFGQAFQYVTYVECLENAKKCLAEGVQGYPTWKKPNGEKEEGFMELTDLANWAGYKF